MSSIIDFIKNNKVVIISAAGGVVLVIILFSILFAFSGNRSENAGSAEDEPVEQTDNGFEPGRAGREVEPESEEEGAQADLPEEIAALREAYTQEDESFDSLLSGTTWTGVDGKNKLTFKDGIMCETVWDEESASGVDIKRAYAISDVTDNSNVATSEAAFEERDCVITLENGASYVLRAVREKGAEGSAAAIEISSEAFTSSESGKYTNAYASEDAKVEGLESEDLALLLGKHVDDLDDFLIEYLSLNLGWVSEVSWDGTATLDSVEDTITLQFTVFNIDNVFAPDDSSNGTLSVVYNRATQKFEEVLR